jgi:hypothetical protein
LRDLDDPSELIIRVTRKDEKKRFALPFAPVRDGVRTKEGDISKYPQGGPLGILEGIISDLCKVRGRNRLKELYKSDETILSLVKVLVSFVASIDAKVAAQTVRVLDEDLLGRVMQHSLEPGLQVLEKQFKWEISHELLSPDILSKIKFGTLNRGGYPSLREGYLAEVRRSKEAQIKAKDGVNQPPKEDDNAMDD